MHLCKAIEIHLLHNTCKMKNNSELQKDVLNAIKWEPTLHAAEIGVTAKDGVVTLSGNVSSYSKKISAEDAVKKVRGVKAIAEDIIVDLGNIDAKDDSKIANSIVKAYQYFDEVLNDNLKIIVENGNVYLDGQVDWKLRKDAYEESIKNIAGIKKITNVIKVKAESTDFLERSKLESALTRHCSIDDKIVKVEVKGDTVKLTGLVHSLHQKEEADRLAWKAKGVGLVENELAVIY